METSRYVVVGAGLAGAATALSLARAGHEVTVVERTSPAAHDGSSHGSARIFRYAYPDAFYTDLVVRSKALWDDLETAGGRRLITPTGAVDFGVPRQPAALARVLDAAGVEHELLGPAEARSRWPGIAVDTDVLWHPAAGVIDAEVAVRTMLDLAVRHGARLLTHWPVRRVLRSGSGYVLVSGTGERLSAERVVASVGGWLPELLADLPLPSAFVDRLPALTVRQEQAFHFPYRDLRPDDDPGAQRAPWPTFIHKSPDIQVYGLPGGRDAAHRGQKVAQYNGGRALRSAADQDGVVSDANRQRVVAYVERYLPGLVPEPYAETTCLFTSTPTEDFLVDGTDGITLLSPCSGHGAKFAPLIGDLAAGVATGASAPPDRFRVGRSLTMEGVPVGA